MRTPWCVCQCAQPICALVLGACCTAGLVTSSAQASVESPRCAELMPPTAGSAPGASRPPTLAERNGPEGEAEDSGSGLRGMPVGAYGHSLEACGHSLDAYGYSQGACGCK